MLLLKPDKRSKNATQKNWWS